MWNKIIQLIELSKQVNKKTFLHFKISNFNISNLIQIFVKWNMQKIKLDSRCQYSLASLSYNMHNCGC